MRRRATTRQVILPEQTLDSGVVRFTVVESRLASVRVEGNHYFSSENYRRALVSLRPGTTPNFDEMVDNLRMVNDNPARQATVVMRPALRRARWMPWCAHRPAARALCTDVRQHRQCADRAVPHRRRSPARQSFDRDHVASQAITSPLRARQVHIYGFGYQAPVYETNGSVGLFLGYSNVNSGQVNTAAGNFNIAGSGIVFGLRHTQLLPKHGDWEHKLAFGWDWRACQSNVTIVGGTTKLVPDVTVIRSAYVADLRRKADEDVSAYVTLVQNLPGGNDGNDTQFQQIGGRPGRITLYQIVALRFQLPEGSGRGLGDSPQPHRPAYAARVFDLGRCSASVELTPLGGFPGA